MYTVLYVYMYLDFQELIQHDSVLLPPCIHCLPVPEQQTAYAQYRLKKWQ